MYRVCNTVANDFYTGTWREAQFLLEGLVRPRLIDGEHSTIQVLCPTHGWSPTVGEGSCLPCYAQLAEECGDDETIWGYDPD
jgi:hypothetical protein